MSVFVRSIFLSCINGVLLLSLLFGVLAERVSAEQAGPTLSEQVTALRGELSRLGRQLEIATTRTLSESPPDAKEMNDIIENSVAWLINAQEEKGHFNYEYAPYEDRYLNDDHMVRQAGALYILGEVVQRDSDGVFDLNEPIEQAVAFFEGISKVGDFNDKSFRCITDSRASTRCQLGATSLALVGVLSLIETYPEYEEQYGTLIEDYVQYILAMKKEDAGFRNYFYTSQDNQKDAESSFSNGEALLALVRYHRYSKDEEVKQVIDKTFDYFRSERSPFDVPLYLWVMTALKDMHATWPSDDYVTYVKEYTDWRIDGATVHRGTDNNWCAYLEGVVGAYSILQSKYTPEELRKYTDDMNFWLSKNKYFQVDNNDAARLVADEDGVHFESIENLELAHGGFLTADSVLTQRIDYTQHCLSSYLQKLVDIDGIMLGGEGAF